MSSLRLRRLHLQSKAILCCPFHQLRLGVGAATFAALPHPHPRYSFSSLPSKEAAYHSETANAALTREDLTEINLLIPRLCSSNQLATAVRLTTTALLGNPLLKSLSVSVLIDSLASQPDMIQAMSLLTHLKHTPTSHPYVRPICLMLISSYFHKHKCKQALKVFRWMERPDSPCSLDEKIYGILIDGFCSKGFVLEALQVLRAMVAGNMAPSCDSKELVYRGLLREARIKEAMELNDALSCTGAEGLKRILVLLEQMIAEWTD